MFTKKFWGHFFTTLKEARHLLLKYLVVAICVSISSIVANRMNLIHLTYFNAMILVAYFFSFFSFALSQGIGIYIGQNITDKKKVNNYIKSGFYVVLVVCIIFVLLVAIFKDFVIYNLLGLTGEGFSNLFYYLMLVYAIFGAIVDYVINIHKKIDGFRHMFINSLVNTILFVVGFGVILAFKNISLVPIAVVYIISTFVAMLYTVISLAKNKTFACNLFALSKVSLKKREWITIIQITLSEVVWSVGYTFCSMMILKSNDIMYNQYSYFENVLDMFNSLFYAFASIISIRVARLYGAGRKDEAYAHVKFSIYSAIVIWSFYAICVTILAFPISMGMNAELRSTAFISMAFYVGLYLLRFLQWNFTSYTLQQTGAISRQLLIHEIVWMAFYIALYFVIGFLPSNIYFLYFLLYIEYIVRLPISFAIYKKRKWLEPEPETEEQA